MPDTPLLPLQGRFWRMLGIRWQHRPHDSGSHLAGERWNPPGTRALYLSADYNTAIQEMHQDLVRPGTLVAFDVTAGAAADLTQADPAITHCLWRDLHMIRRETPPSWTLATALIARGAEGALVPSVQHRGGRNLVLWRWHAAPQPEGAGEGASLTLLDPEALLGQG